MLQCDWPLYIPLDFYQFLLIYWYTVKNRKARPADLKRTGDVEMKRLRKVIVGVSLLFSILIILAGCSRRKLTPYPVSNGDYLEYKSVRRDKKHPFGFRSFVRYEIRALEDGKFEVRHISKLRDSSGNQDVHEVPNFARTYDTFGRLIAQAAKGGVGKNKGRFSKLWLPPTKRKPGAKVLLENYFKHRAVVQKPTRWENREVYVLKIYNYTYFYDKKSGFLVGEDDTVMKKILVDSNIKGL